MTVPGSTEWTSSDVTGCGGCDLSAVAPGRFGLSSRNLRLEHARSEAARRELKRELDQAKRLARYQNCAISITAHDLGRPLGLIVGILEAHARQTDSVVSRLWTDIGLEEVARIHHALEDLMLDVACGTAVSGSAGEDSVALGELFTTLADDWRFLAVAKGLKFETVPTRLRVLSDPLLLQAILNNLVSNAVRHTSSGGVVFGCRRRGDNVWIDVVDTGPGLGAWTKSALASPDWPVSGLGSGLSLVREACTLAGHRLCVDSLGGRGTRVSVIVPRDPSARLRP